MVSEYKNGHFLMENNRFAVVLVSLLGSSLGSLLGSIQGLKSRICRNGELFYYRLQNRYIYIWWLVAFCYLCLYKENINQ